MQKGKGFFFQHWTWNCFSIELAWLIIWGAWKFRWLCTRPQATKLALFPSWYTNGSSCADLPHLASCSPGEKGSNSWLTMFSLNELSIPFEMIVKHSYKKTPKTSSYCWIWQYVVLERLLENGWYFFFKLWFVLEILGESSKIFCSEWEPPYTFQQHKCSYKCLLLFFLHAYIFAQVFPHAFWNSQTTKVIMLSPGLYVNN